MRFSQICALVAAFQMPDSARILQRRLQVIPRTSPILVAGSAYGRAVASWWRQNFEARKKTPFSASSHIVIAAFLHGHRIPRGPSYAEPKSIIMLLPKLTCPSCVTWLLVRLPICLSCHIQVPLPYPRKPPRLAAGQKHNQRRGHKMWGGGACDDRGPTFCLRRSPPQEPPEENAPPAQRGPRREMRSRRPLSAQRPSWRSDLSRSTLLPRVWTPKPLTRA